MFAAFDVATFSIVSFFRQRLQYDYRSERGWPVSSRSTEQQPHSYANDFQFRSITELEAGYRRNPDLSAARKTINGHLE